MEYHPATRQFFSRFSKSAFNTGPTCVVIAEGISEPFAEDFIDYAEYHEPFHDGSVEAAKGLYQSWLDAGFEEGGSHV